MLKLVAIISDGRAFPIAPRNSKSYGLYAQYRHAAYPSSKGLIKKNAKFGIRAGFWIF